MKPLLVLLGVFILALIGTKIFTKKVDFQLSGRIAFSIMLIFTAVGHFAYTEGMMEMLPEFIPLKKQVVLITGILEILFAIGLLIPDYTRLTGWMVIGFLILVLPANINAAVENVNFQSGETNGPGLSYLWFRVPLQLFFIAWIYLVSIKKISVKA